MYKIDATEFHGVFIFNITFVHYKIAFFFQAVRRTSRPAAASKIASDVLAVWCSGPSHTFTTELL